MTTNNNNETKVTNIVNVYNVGNKKKLTKSFADDMIELGVLRERQRIIKLIEESNKQYAQPSEESEALWELIALIKEKH